MSMSLNRSDSYGMALIEMLKDCGIALTPVIEPEAKKAPPRANTMNMRGSGSFKPYWREGVPVEELKNGHHFRHSAFSYDRKIISIKPHPQGGMVVKSIPAWTFRNEPGKILKHHVRGFARSWDGVTTVEQR